jgi:hypothetical protein
VEFFSGWAERKRKFKMRWEGELEAQFTEPYSIHLVSDDRARLWLNGRLIIDEWAEHSRAESSALVHFGRGQRYLLRVEYYENRGAALVHLLWSSPSTPKQIIPKSQLYSQVANQSGDGLPDLWKEAFGFEIEDGEVAKRDTNEDGFTNLELYKLGEDPLRLPAPAVGLASSWANREIGATGPGAQVIQQGDMISIQGAGANIWGNADSFHFVYRAWSGDGEITARLAGLDRIQCTW